MIEYAGRGAVVLGEIDGRTTSRLRELHRAFLDFEDRAIVTANIWGYLWGKLAYGAQLFATALTDDPIADALADPAYRDVYVEIAREVMRVAQARHITPEMSTAPSTIPNSAARRATKPPLERPTA